MAQARTYIPPLRYRVLTRLYDPVVRVTTRENTVKRAVIDQLDPRPGDVVLDLGCGTATLAIAIAARCPRSHIVGVDADPDRRRALADREIDLEEGFAVDACDACRTGADAAHALAKLHTGTGLTGGFAIWCFGTRRRAEFSYPLFRACRRLLLFAMQRDPL